MSALLTRIATLLAMVVALMGTACNTETPEPTLNYIVGGESVAANADTDVDSDTDTDTSLPVDTATDDADADGFTAADDCDDSNAAVNPGAAETCNAIDDNCNGSIDEGVTSTWYLDLDMDGYGDNSRTGVQSCAAPTTDYVSNGSDCDDTNLTVNPAGIEVCDSDDVDENCDGVANGSDALGATIWFGDVDGDGYGTMDAFMFACDVPVGYSDNVSDCDDADSTAHPDGTELCDGVDNDCDGVTDNNADDALTYYADTDADGFGDADSSQDACDMPSGYVVDDTDCDDARADVNPDASESCNGRDDNCDGVTDEASAVDATTWYLDRDSDGFGSSSVSYVACTAPGGYVGNATDCDDANPAAYPGGTELCDGVDNDCDGTVDNNATDADTWYADDDGDGYGNAADSTDACDQPTGYVADDTDCSDTSSSYHPGADESDCTDPNDYNCDDSVQYEDDDGDGFAACEDCDDARTDVNPDASESCNGRDDNCDGTTDGTDAIDKITLYRDTDGDTFGSDGVTYASCLSTAPSGYVVDGGDCDDADVAFNPGAAEADCTDPNDYNCDGSVGYTDADGDGYAACEDCDDTEAAANSGEVEVCDDIDNDCDGTTDEDSAVDASTWYADSDGDGYGDIAVTDVSCDVLTGYVGNATDCDDTRGATNPAAREYCNGIDDDCDGSTDESDAVDASTWYYDADGDGYGEASTSLDACAAPIGYIAVAGDCNGTARAVNPAATETCNGIDDDCDGDIDSADASVTGETSWYIDADEDGYGLSTSTAIIQCDDPSTATTYYADNNTDCRDTNDTVHPSATEVTGNGLDDDCDVTTSD